MKRWDIANNPSRHDMQNNKKAWKQSKKQQPHRTDVEDLIATKKKEQDNA